MPKYNLRPHKVQMKKVTLLNLKVATQPGKVAQRVATQERIDKLSREWITSAAGPLIVSERANGDQYVVDGWGRTNAAIANGIDTLMAEVHYGLTLAEEATLFLLKNKESKQVSVLDNYNVGLTAGDPVYVQTQAMLDKHSLVAGGSGANGVGAVAAIVRITESYGADTLDRALSIAEATWGRSAKSWDGMILGGLGRFLHKHGGDVKDHDLVKKIQPLGVPELVIQKIITRASVGSTQQTGTGGRISAAYGTFLDAYNKGRRYKLAA